MHTEMCICSYLMRKSECGRSASICVFAKRVRYVSERFSQHRKLFFRAGAYPAHLWIVSSISLIELLKYNACYV